LAKRRRFSRWRRLPGVYRFGDEKPADPNSELQRLSLYVTGSALDRAEMQALRLGYENVQDYCTDVLLKAIEAEHVREHVAEVEAKRGPLEGLHQIAEDVEYLAEFRAAAESRGHGEPSEAPRPLDGSANHVVPVDVEGPRADHAVRLVAPPETDHATESDTTENSSPTPSLSPVPAAASPAAELILKHAGQGGDEPFAFLPCLRRGESVPPAEVAELAQALSDLEREYRGARLMDRELIFALHRLAFESQILQTDAWPGAFDVWTVDMIRAVQEAVERILSGQDIRYYATAPAPAFLPPPETPR